MAEIIYLFPETDYGAHPATFSVDTGVSFLGGKATVAWISF